MGRSWRDDAACSGDDPRYWTIPDDGQPQLPPEYAIRVCVTCPVRVECLAEAIEQRDYGQIRGGVVLRSRHRWVDCVRCRRPFSSTTTGGKVTYCPPCLVARRLEIARRRKVSA